MKKLSSYFPIKELIISSKSFKQNINIKYYVLFGVVIFSLIVGSSAPFNIETFTILFSRNATIIGWLFVGFMFILSIFHFRFWCKYFCPAGGFLNLIPKIKSKSLYKQESKEKEVKKHSKNDRFFIFLIFISLVFIFILISDNTRIILNQTKALDNNKSMEQSANNKQTSKYDDLDVRSEEVTKIKNKLQASGIKPVEAKYWKSIEPKNPGTQEPN